MASRRMFSKDITENDAFLDMPLSTQALYFHLGMQADDDGFLTPNRVIRMIGAQKDDLKILIGKKFVLEMDGGVLVIKHWRINNFIRKDIYKETKHAALKGEIYLRPNGAYTTDPDGASPIPSGHYQVEKALVNVALTSRQRSIGKDRLGKDRLYSTKNKKEESYKDFDKFELNDGTIARLRYGKWVDDKSESEINGHYYKELPIL